MKQCFEGAAVAVTKGLAATANLTRLLGCPIVRHGSDARYVLAWGRKPSAAKAETYAAKRGLPILRIEDGFIRSVGLGHEDPPLSIAVDDLGIYYDACTPSRLERLIPRPLSAEQTARARVLIQEWQIGRVSKYCGGREQAVDHHRRYVLALDQTLGDASIKYGLANEQSFARMLEAALLENPECDVLLKIHPDVAAGRKHGHFQPEELARNPRIRVISGDAYPVPWLEKAEKVYVVTSQLGFEALLWGKPTRTFGMPFYAGWGLTSDALPPPERRTPVALENVVHATLVEYCHYLDPETGERCEPERLLEWLGFQRRMRERFPPKVYACGFSPWKRPILKDFLQGSAVEFIDEPAQAPAGASVAVWGRRAVEPSTQAKILRLEDGFLRSVGLGADLVRPVSWVVDSRGLYYDPAVPSDLESILADTCFDAQLLARAEKLRASIIENRLTKYNLRGSHWKPPEGRRRVILVPGQVETDASVLAGGGSLQTNLALLREVRARNPDAHLIYKPHPDVVAGLRRAGERENDAGGFCDEMLASGDMGALLDAVDEVHVLTSLAGFEALLRGKKVACYGTPFYAGWGLTEDAAPLERRRRKLTLNELTAGVLILYPTYLSRATRRFTTPERALTELLEWRAASSRGTPLWRRILRRILQFNSR